MTNNFNTINSFSNVTELIRNLNFLKKKYPTALVYSMNTNLLSRVALGWVNKDLYPNIKPENVITNLELKDLILSNKDVESNFYPVIVLGE